MQLAEGLKVRKRLVIADDLRVRSGTCHDMSRHGPHLISAPECGTTTTSVVLFRSRKVNMSRAIYVRTSGGWVSRYFGAQLC